MKTGPILSLLKTVWKAWSIQAVVLLSLSMQAILILLTPLRKKSANTWLIFCIWLAYLLADWVAAFAVGLISYRQMNDKSAPDYDGDLIAFWAPFLLVHLAGPHTITAFALEDNALWLRHLLSIISQVCVSIYVFCQTLPKNNLWFLTVLMLFPGLIKCVERTRALYLANLNRFIGSAVQDLDPVKALKNYFLRLCHASMDSVAIKEGELDGIEVVEYGYRLFHIFDWLAVEPRLADSFFRDSPVFFRKISAADAFKVISVELNFMYGNLYTKILVVHSKWGYFFRVVTASIVVVTLVLFIRLEKHGYDIYDCMVTYALLCGAIGLDVIALLMLMLSDWSVLTLIKRAPNLRRFLTKYVSFINKLELTDCHIEPAVKSKSSLRTQILKKFRSTCISFVSGNNKSVSWTSQIKPSEKFKVFNTKIWFRRWSESIFAYNLLTTSLGLHPQKILKDEQRILWCTAVLAVPRVAVLCFGLIGWAILRCCGWLTKAVSTGLAIPFDYLTDKLSLREVLDGLKLKSVLSYVWTKHANEDDEAKGRCGIISKLCLFPLYILGLVRYCFNIATEAIDNGFYVGLIATNCLRVLGLDGVLDSMKYVSRNPFLVGLWYFIFEELKVKSKRAEDPEMAKWIFGAKGESVLINGEGSGDVTNIMEYLTGDYYKILLQWHIATELCYNTDENLSTQNDEREFSKILSDYMLYLLIKQPKMLSIWAFPSQLRFLFTLQIAKYYISEIEMEDVPLRDACQGLLNMDHAPDSEEDEMGSMMGNGCYLAKKLQEREDKWGVMSRVWVEILSYAAVRCKAEAHAQALARGGELVTFVWFLMVHLGLGDEF